MARAKSWTKDIVCFETLWDPKRDVDAGTRVSVVQVFEVAARINRVRFSHFTCNTRGEFEHDLKVLRARRGSGILYLGFHGGPGKVWLNDGSDLSLEALAELMGGRFARWGVHLAGCDTLNPRRVKQARVRSFLERTGASIVLGYKHRIWWMESAALDLLIVDWLQWYRDMKYFWRDFRRRYGGLVRRVGLTAVPG